MGCYISLPIYTLYIVFGCRNILKDSLSMLGGGLRSSNTCMCRYQDAHKWLFMKLKTLKLYIALHFVSAP